MIRIIALKRLFIGICLVAFFSLQAQALTIGTLGNYPPFSSLADQDNHFFGFEVDLIEAICHRIKRPCTLKPINIKEVQQDLMYNKIDLAIAAYIIPDTPPSGYIFSLPYLASSAEFITHKNSPISTLDQLVHKKIGVKHGTLFDDLLEERYGANVTIKKYMNREELVTALNKNDIDAVLVDSVAADYWVVNTGGLYKIVGTKIPIGNGYGILANVGEENLIKAVNEALQNMMSDGSYAKIYSTYF